VLITSKALTPSVAVTSSRPFARSKLKFPPDILRLLAFLIAFIGFPLVANAVKINDTDSSVIYSTAGDEGTGPTWNVQFSRQDYRRDEHFSNFSTTPTMWSSLVCRPGRIA
jgi:hypothetical protein